MEDMKEKGISPADIQDNAGVGQEPTTREMCWNCWRPKASCFCKYTAPVDSGIKFIFLMHPKEYRKQRTGTGRLASICLPGSEIFVGIDFTNDPKLNALLKDPQYYPVLMYPSDDAWHGKKEGFTQAVKGQGKKLLAILIDSTWFCSKKMIRYSSNINSLPKVSFYGQYKSIFTFKHEPKEYCVSTIETCYYLIKELQESGISNPDCDPEPLMNVFKEMIKYQLQKENDRIEGRIPTTHEYDWKYTKKRDIPDFK